MSAPRSRLKKFAIAGGIVLVLLYAGIAAFLYFAQSSLLFFPTHASEAELAELREQGSPLEITSQGETLRGVLLRGEGEAPRPTLMYFGGNGEAVLAHADGFAPVRAAGWNVALLPYRGYDLSSGEPSADAFRADALALHDHLLTMPEVERTHMLALGYSMGSGVAVSLAAKRELLGLMLAAPYARLSDLAADAYPWLPVRMLFRHEFDSETLAAQLSMPALVFHGEADPVIPIAHGQRLQAAWGGELEFHAVPGAPHNGMSTRLLNDPATLRFLTRVNAP